MRQSRVGLITAEISLRQIAFMTDSTFNPPQNLSLSDLSESQLKQLADLHRAYEIAANARLQGIDCDYFEGSEEAALLPWLPLYREKFDIPSVRG